ncbi:MAG: domain protein beta Propeller [Ilumatobacteraceae bacterium]|nr:domain protein beta Propeller [Ilumatobacteraceae bacterium]
MPHLPPVCRRTTRTIGANRARRTARSRALRTAPLLAASVLAATVLAAPAPAGAAASDHPVTSRASATATGGQTAGSAFSPAISGDGRWVAYLSKGPGPVPGFAPSHLNVYRYDRATGVSVVASPAVAGTGGQANADSDDPQISGNGRYISFESDATNLVSGDGNGKRDIFRRDLVLGTTQLVSRVTGGGAAGNLPSDNATMSADGSSIAFESAATNLVAGADANGQYDSFVWSGNGQVIRLANKVGGSASNGGTLYPAISADGSTVAYQSSSSNLPVAGVGSGDYDIYVQPATGGTITRANVPSTGPGGPNQGGYVPQISGDGTRVIFNSQATNLVAADTNAKRDAFLRNLSAGTTTRISTNAFGGQLTAGGDVFGISTDGQVTAFRTPDDQVLTLPNPSFHQHVYARAANGSISAIDLRDANGAFGDTGSGTGALSATGRYVVFDSLATDLVRNDTNATWDVFVRDRQATSEPFDSWSGLVQQQHTDFTGKPASAAVVAEEAARLANGETTVGRFLVDMAHDPAWSAKRGPVIRLYWSFFLRAPDKSGMAYWLAKSENGMNLPTMAERFAVSSEFANSYGKLSDTDFVELVYGNVLQRKADAAGLAHWVAKLQTGMTRGGMMTQFSESSEGKRVMAPYVDVLLLHLGLLRALPTTGVFGAETLAVANGVSPISQIADDLRMTSAYASRTAS